jgi:hypothetical protein
VLKGKLKNAKRPDLGMLPAMFTPPPAFGELAPNEIVVQYPAVTTRASDWAAAAPLVPGERAIFIFGAATTVYQSPAWRTAGDRTTRPTRWSRWGGRVSCRPLSGRG